MVVAVAGCTPEAKRPTAGRLYHGAEDHPTPHVAGAHLEWVVAHLVRHGPGRPSTSKQFQRVPDA
jgi:hypothetical protein